MNDKKVLFEHVDEVFSTTVYKNYVSIDSVHDKEFCYDYFQPAKVSEDFLFSHAVSDSEKEVYLENYGNIFSSVGVFRDTYLVTRTTNGVTLASYSYNKSRKVGIRYFGKGYTRRFFHINLKTGNFYCILQSKTRGKRAEKPQIWCNKSMFNFNMVNRMKEDQTLVSALKVFWNEVGYEPSTYQRLESKDVYGWFVKENGIKVPDNYHDLLQYSYPTKRILRKKKNDNNLVKAIMDKYGLHGKYYRKVMNRYPNMPILFLVALKKILGEKRIKEIKFDYSDRVKISMFHIPSYLMDNLYEIDDRLKTYVINTLNNENVLFDTSFKLATVFEALVDDVRMIEELKFFESDYRHPLNPQSFYEFTENHYQLSRRLTRWKNNTSYEYIFNDTLIKKLNVVKDGVAYKVLSSTNDYIEEGNYQRHCVGSYAGSTDSLIISLRKGKVRATLEFGFNGELIQAKGKCNSTPDKEFNSHISNCKRIVKSLKRTNHLQPATLQLSEEQKFELV